MSQPTFVWFVVARNAEEFEAAARVAARLKPFGKVEMSVGHLAAKAFHEMPEGGSSWHDYTIIRSALERIVPHEKLQPFVDTKFAAKNLELLRTHAAINRELGLGSALGIHAPWFWPEGFFEKYPHLRGPRIDHPRRGRREEFAPCIDQPEVQEILTSMMAAIDRELPELGTVRVWTNDAGGGLCWADWLYPGVNGPEHCRNKGSGRRAKDLAEALSRGCAKKPTFHLYGNFSEAEVREISLLADDDFFLTARHAANPKTLHLTGQLIRPVRGIFDPVDLIKRLEKFSPQTRTVFMDFHANSQRGSELPKTMDKIVDVVEAYLAKPVRGVEGRMGLLKELCTKWAGADSAGALLDALHAFHEAMTYKNATLPRYGANGAGVSMRHITRPLVAMPERLTAEEESWWLPHVFNMHASEARLDYLDYHGSKLVAAPADPDEADPRPAAAKTARTMLLAAAAQLDKIGGIDGFFARMGTAIRIEASILRSIANFVGTQIVRDAVKDKLAGPPTIPPKVGDWNGDPYLQLLNEFMRDELDNTGELVSILENGGIGLMLLAKDAANEDTFLLGPDLIEQLRKKMKVMRAHWIDAQDYLQMPHK
jgi:hypothetical protein